MLAAKLWNLVWWQTLSPDEVVRRFIDDLSLVEEAETLGVSGEVMKGFADLSIEPDVLEDVAIMYLRRYRSAYVILYAFLSSVLTLHQLILEY